MLLEARGLRKAYGGKEVLHGIGLQLEERGVLAIIGPNGAGKSTLLRLLNLIEEPTSGRIIFEGKDISCLDGLAVRRRMGAVLQGPVLFEGTVSYNVGYGLRVRGMEGGKAVSDALEKVGLGGFGERRVRELSGGECQRVALARAIAFAPDLLLLDEPTANIDNENAALVEKAIVQAGKKATVVLSTHNLFQAKRIADSTAFMEAGKIVERKATGELFSEPEDARTRRFVGGSSVF